MGQGHSEAGAVNKSLLRVVLIVQALFAFSLIYIGTRARENRKQDYLELTHRVTSGQASEEDFVRLSKMLPFPSDKEIVRSLFGLPLETRGELVIEESSPEPDNTKASSAAGIAKSASKKGEFWLYSPAGEDGKLIGPQEFSALKGRVRCFVVEFDSNGRAHPEMTWVVRP